MSLKLIQLVQGGMGVDVSTPPLAKEVSMRGGQGTVTGAAADIVVARKLQKGDPGGDYRRALAHFPFPEIAKLVLDEYFVPSDDPTHGPPFKSTIRPSLDPSRLAIALLVCANFAIVWLAKEGHSNPISINYLEKMAMVHLHSIYGAMLAGIDIITMGAGIPLHIPAVLDAYARGEAAEYPVPITGLDSGTITMRFDPATFFGQSMPALKRPKFLPIVSSDTLAKWLNKELPGRVDGFVIEGPEAGGHSAKPRRKPPAFNSSGEPVYDDLDKPNFKKLVALGLPFWLAGGYASPHGLAQALSVGATGIQAGSIFALCNESGLDPKIRREIIRLYHHGKLRVRKDPRASSTGYPFNVVQMFGTLSDDGVYSDRHRTCSQGALLTPHRLPNGSIVYRCSAEPVRVYQANGGDLADTIGVRCLCNGLLSVVRRGDPGEPPIGTLGSDTGFLRYLTPEWYSSYTAAQAMEYLLGPALQ